MKKNDLSYVHDKSFDDLRGMGGGQLAYDFYIKKTNILIEYQGKQHYKEVYGKEVLERQKEHDRRKREYAKQRGYHLIEIHYKYDTYEKIEAYLDEHLLPLLSKVS